MEKMSIEEISPQKLIFVIKVAPPILDDIEMLRSTNQSRGLGTTDQSQAQIMTYLTALTLHQYPRANCFSEVFHEGSQK